MPPTLGSRAWFSVAQEAALAPGTPPTRASSCRRQSCVAPLTRWFFAMHQVDPNLTRRGTISNWLSRRMALPDRCDRQRRSGAAPPATAAAVDCCSATRTGDRPPPTRRMPSRRSPAPPPADRTHRRHSVIAPNAISQPVRSQPGDSASRHPAGWSLSTPPPRSRFSTEAAHEKRTKTRCA